MKSAKQPAKFVVHERVLCYEPDLTKARVVYDAKILKIECPDAKRSPKEFHYLVHFQGWSSTWDRYVTDDFLLKTTNENRELQKKLFSEAEAATNSIKKKAKKKRKRLSETLSVSVDEDDGESSSKKAKVQSSPSTSSQISIEIEPSVSGSKYTIDTYRYLNRCYHLPEIDFF